MKNKFSISFYALFLTAFFSFNSCSKDEADETQTVSYTVPNHEACLSDYPGQYTEVSTNDITTADVQQAFATTGVTYDASKIITAKLVSLKATATGSNFDEISTIEVLYQSNSGFRKSCCMQELKIIVHQCFHFRFVKMNVFKE